MKKIKEFAEVRIGDKAHCGDISMGAIIWKGTVEELLKLKYSHIIEDSFDYTVEELEGYDLVIVDDGTICSYNNDPCGVVVFK